MKEFDKYLKQLKGGLNDFMTPEKDKATIDKIASFSSLIDNMESEYQTMKSEYDELKTDYINAVKNQKFQNNGSTDNGNDFKSDDEIINEILGL